VERLGNFECLHRARRLVHVAHADEQPPVEQHPNGLDGVERHALGAFEDLLTELLGSPGTSPDSS
jgi:hypothetical protein